MRANVRQLRSYSTFDPPRPTGSSRNRCCPYPTSKSLVLVLIWTAVVGFINSVINTSPDHIITSIVSEDKAHIILVVVVMLYIAFAINMICYPFGGFLADVYYGRYKVIAASLICLALSMLMAFILFLCSIQIHVNILSSVWKKGMFVLGALMTFIPLAIGLAGFTSNIVQFGLDQLQDVPSIKLSAFIHLYVWANRLGNTVFDMMYAVKECFFHTSIETKLTDGLLYALPSSLFVVLFALTLLNCCAHRMFNKERVKYNPYKMIVRVLRFAKKHKRPVGHPTAFAYCDDYQPSRMDFAKERYGGPFTTADVEDVKTFIRIFLMLFTLGPIFVTCVPTSFFLFLGFAVNSGTSAAIGRDSCSANWLLLESGLLSGLFSTAILPLYMLLFPVLSRRNCLPKILNRIVLGSILFTITITNMLAVDVAGNVLVMGERNSTCMLTQFPSIISEPLNLHWWVLIFPNLTKTLALDLIMASAFEFISAQSPHTMRGVLVGMLFAVRGFFQLIEAISLIPFSSKEIWKTFDHKISCESSYYLFTAVVSIAGLIAFIIAARKYQYRKREEAPYSQSQVEEIYDRLLTDRERRIEARKHNLMGQLLN